MKNRKTAVFAAVLCLTASACAAFASDIAVISRKTEDKDFSRSYCVTLDDKTVKSRGDYYTVETSSVSEISETLKPGETRETKREEKVLYAFHKTQRKYKILDAASFESSKMQGASCISESSSGSSASVRTCGVDDWQQLPSDKEDCLNKLYDKTIEIAAGKR